jgi:hypothetical protein
MWQDSAVDYSGRLSSPFYREADDRGSMHGISAFSSERRDRFCQVRCIDLAPAATAISAKGHLVTTVDVLVILVVNRVRVRKKRGVWNLDK